MVNLFRQAATDEAGLTVALLALLEHSDRRVLAEFLQLAGWPFDLSANSQVQFTDSTIGTPHFRLRVAAQAPGEPWDPPPPGSDTLAITLGGGALAGARSLTWEQVDRWLAATAERFDPESRTGFLVGQFREFLKEVGIEYFPGFAGELLESAPEALGVVNRFYAAAEDFFEQLGHLLRGGASRVTEVRRSRAEDLLAGFCYRDYTGPAFGPAGFLRIALDAPAAQLQVSLWLSPGTDSHARLRSAAVNAEPLLESLRGLTGSPVLRLWSAENQMEIAVDDLPSETLSAVDLSKHQAAVQLSLAFPDLAGEGAVERVGLLQESLVRTLSPILTTPLH